MGKERLHVYTTTRTHLIWGEVAFHLTINANGWRRYNTMVCLWSACVGRWCEALLLGDEDHLSSFSADGSLLNNTSITIRGKVENSTSLRILKWRQSPLPTCKSGLNTACQWSRLRCEPIAGELSASPNPWTYHSCSYYFIADQRMIFCVSQSEKYSTYIHRAVVSSSTS